MFSSSVFTDRVFNLSPVIGGCLELLKKLGDKKATGLDNIPARLLKDGAPAISRTVTYIINLSLTTSTVPDDWKQARVVPVPKTGNCENMDNYRPISILPVLSKVLESTVNVQLQQFLRENDRLSPIQSDFRRYHSTQTTLTYFCGTILRNSDEEKMIGALFIELKKAFDTVPHDCLLKKLGRINQCVGLKFV